MDGNNSGNINNNISNHTVSNNWTVDIENLLEKIRTNCITLSKAHKREYHKTKHLLSYFRVPIIVISAFASVISVGLQPYLEQQTISVATCLINLVIGVISSLELYLSIQQTMELELSVSKDYYTLSINIYRMLQLESVNRNTDAHSFLDNCYGEYLKLFEKSNLLKKKLADVLIPINERGNTKSFSLVIPHTPSNQSDPSDSSE